MKTKTLRDYYNDFINNGVELNIKSGKLKGLVKKSHNEIYIRSLENSISIFIDSIQNDYKFYSICLYRNILKIGGL